MAGNDERLERAFSLIGKGNQFEDIGDNWQAAQCFGDAMRILFQLAIEMDPKTPEEEKIEGLYQSQCRDYLHRARKALLQALSDEDEGDKSDVEADPKFITLSLEEAKQRVRLFGTLFSKQLDLEVQDLVEEDFQEQQDSIEARLKSLNDSLPSSFKTDDERMKEIDRGLKGLGLSLYSHAGTERSDFDLPKSSADQVADIIAQAKDEAHFEALHGRGTRVTVEEEDDIILTEDEEDDDLLDDDDVDEEDEVLEVEPIPKLRNKKVIRKHIANAQVKLAQLVVMLDDGTPLHKELDNGQDDDDSTSPAERVGFELDQALIMLRKAEKNLSKAVSSWEVEAP